MWKLGFAFLVVMSAHAASAQEDISGRLLVELNSVKPSDDACTLSFLVTNGFEQQIEEAVFEVVLFDTEGAVNQLTLFNFGQLPPARPRVRQFAVPGLGCDSLGKLLFNGITTCSGDGLGPKECLKALQLESRSDKVEVLG